VTYFGDGPDSLVEQRSEYSLQSVNIVGYATLRPRQWLSIDGRAGWVRSPSISEPAGSFERGNPATQEVFPDDPVFARGDQPDYGHGEVSVAADDRDHRSYPTRGGLYRAAWSGYSDRGTGGFSFSRSAFEVARFVPLASSRVVLAAHGWLVATHAADDQAVPFYLAPSLGGHNTLRGYADYRFHDRSTLVVNLESRIALFTHLDVAGFADAGNVAPRASALNLDRRSYGVGVRMHTRRSTFARFDVAHGSEGWRFVFRLNDPLHMSRISKRTTPVPFVP
jgi:outer membrane protein assembly factor BamA